MREAAAQSADAWATDAQRQHGDGGPASAIRALPLPLPLPPEPDLLSPRFLAQQIIFSFLKLDPSMSLYAAVALLMVYQAQESKTPISTYELAKELSLSPSTTTRLMTYLSQGKEDEGFNGLNFVDLQIDKKDRRRRSVTMTKLGTKTIKLILPMT